MRGRMKACKDCAREFPPTVAIGPHTHDGWVRKVMLDACMANERWPGESARKAWKQHDFVWAGAAA